MRQIRRSAGFTLVELLLVVVIVGILAVMAAPRIEPVLTRRDVQGGKAAINGLMLRGRAAAVQLRRPVALSVTPDRAFLTWTTADGASQFLSMVDVRSTFGVALSSSAASLTFQPTGLVVGGTPFVIKVAKGSALDSLTVTGYGRIQ